MKVWNIRFLIVALLVMVVAVVFFAPSTDLEPTALRASQAAKMLLQALVSAALILSFLLSFARLFFVHEPSDLLMAGGDDLVTLNCALLC